MRKLKCPCQRDFPLLSCPDFSGAGKTTLLNNVLNNREGMRVAVIVNDMSEVNIDATLVERGGAELSRTEEKLIEMSNGCICCTLRDDLLAEVSRLAQEGRFDYLLIESTGDIGAHSRRADLHLRGRERCEPGAGFAPRHDGHSRGRGELPAGLRRLRGGSKTAVSRWAKKITGR